MFDNFEALANLGKILLGLLWVSTVLWTYKDARRRIDDPILIITAVAMSLVLPLVGIIVYMMLRPPEYLADVRERELEIMAMERQLGRQERCPECKSHIESDFLACPICSHKLRTSCRTCDRPLDPMWSLCPFCETEVPGARRGYDPTPPSRKRERDVPPRRTPAKAEATPSRDKSGGGSRGTSRPSTPVRSRDTADSDAKTRTTKTATPASPVKKSDDKDVDIKTEPFSKFVATELPNPARQPLATQAPSVQGGPLGTAPTTMNTSPFRGDNF